MNKRNYWKVLGEAATVLVFNLICNGLMQRRLLYRQNCPLQGTSLPALGNFYQSC
jgi:hypothetical protein